MKKWIRVILLAGLLMLVGCGEKKTEGGKQEIVIMATDRVENFLKEFIVTYNKESEDYYITYEDFSEDMANYDRMVSNINARIVSDRCPDLVLINYNFFQTYMDGKALEDLEPFLKKSEVLSEEDFLQPVLDAMKKEDAVYGLPKYFNMQVMGGRTSKMGQKQGWSIEEFVTYFQENPDVVLEWDGDSYGILNFCMRYGLDEYVDFEQGKCSFNGSEFKELLTEIKALNRDSSHTENWKSIVEEGGNIMLEFSINSFNDYMRMEEEYQDELTVLGYPTGQGEFKCRLLPSMSMGILAKSKNKDAAWDVLEKYMAWDFGDMEFSAMCESFDAQLIEAKREPDESDNPVHDGAVIKLSEKLVLTKRQEEQIMLALENAVPDNIMWDEIREMVTLGALEYFNGKKDLEEAANMIQSRVQLYLDEQK